MDEFFDVIRSKRVDALAAEPFKKWYITITIKV